MGIEKTWLYRTMVPLRYTGFTWNDDDMRNQAVAEENSSDHFHLTYHFMIPHPSSETPPVMTVTTQRHSNRHVVATGPLFALAMGDVPYPMPGIHFAGYAHAVLATAAVELSARTSMVVWGTGGKTLRENLLPLPLVETDPLW